MAAIRIFCDSSALKINLPHGFENIAVFLIAAHSMAEKCISINFLAKHFVVCGSVYQFISERLFSYKANSIPPV